MVQGGCSMRSPVLKLYLFDPLGFSDLRDQVDLTGRAREPH